MPRPDANSEELACRKVRQILNAVSGTHKKLNLYGEHHKVYKDASNHLKHLLDEFIEESGTLRLEIERNRITYRQETVYEGSSEPGDLASILHRDGLLWLELQEGLETWELDTFFKALRDYAVLDDEAEDDIVTALWEYNLPSISYAADELLLGLEDDIDLEALPCRPPGGEEESSSDHEGAQEAGSHGMAEKETVHIPPGLLDNPASFVLSETEREQLERMIAAEKRLDGSDHVVDVLLYIIEAHSLPEDIDELLAYLGHELRESLAQLRFSYLHIVLIKLRKQIQKLRSVSHRATPLLERFVLVLSDASFLNLLLEISPQIEKCDHQARVDLKAFLSLLAPRAISALGPIMLKTRSGRLQRILISAIAALAKRDIRPLEKLLSSKDKTLAGRLVFILKFIDDAQAARLLTQLLKDESPTVRLQALKITLDRQEPEITPEEMVAMLREADGAIRKLVLQRLERKRAVRSEKMLLAYLKTLQEESDDPDHFMDVCRSLGRCGSHRSIPHLRTMLYKWPVMGILRSRSSIQRRGAIAALTEIATDEAAALVAKSERGFWGNFLRPG